jgi:phosphoserine phosphatase RsbU/P
MPLNPPNAPDSRRHWGCSAPDPSARLSKESKARHPEFIEWLKQYWRRITDGLELSQLWKQFKTDAQYTYRFYERDFGRKSQQVHPNKVLNTIQEFSWAILEKLSPARRVLLLVALLVLVFGGMGFHYVDHAGENRGFDIDLHLYGGAILFVLLMLEVADRVVMKRDLEIARDIQRWLLPANPPQIPGLEMAFATRPANTVAGDYYDIFPRPGFGEDRYLMAVADVAGKSIPAALLMATFQASLKTLSAVPCSLEDLVVGMNRYACSNSQEGLRFTTAFIAEFEVTTKTLTYINAGHNVPILRRGTGTIERLTNGGLPLGILAGARYEEGKAVLYPGDWLTVFTDGLIEAENNAGEEFGEERLLPILNNASLTPPELLKQMMINLDAFVGETPQHDDVTCLLIKVG